MRIVVLNLAYEQARTRAAMLDRFPTLTGLAAALARAGADTHVVQRCPQPEFESIAIDSVRYTFAADDHPACPSLSFAPWPIIDAIAAAAPDIVHVNGLMFPAMVSALRQRLPPAARIVVQDHAGMQAPGAIDRLLQPAWRGLARADAYSFTAAADAAAWRDAGLLNPAAPIFEIVESSTTLGPVSRQEARARSGLAGNPLLLWVGRLNRNKDPITVIRGIDSAFEELPEARLCMIYGDATLERDVRRLVEASARLRGRVTLTGRVPHEDLPLYYTSADLFVSGSHREGSGYALIEAMACGVIPIVTGIPSFRVIAGDCGVRWNAGDPSSLHAALVQAARFDRAAERARTRERFMLHLTWDAIAAKTLAAYRTFLG